MLRYAKDVSRGLYVNGPVRIRSANGSGPVTLVVDPAGASALAAAMAPDGSSPLNINNCNPAATP